MSISVHEEGLEDGDLGDEEVTLASDPIMRPRPKSELVDNEFVEQYRESIKPVIEMIEKKITIYMVRDKLSNPSTCIG